MRARTQTLRSRDSQAGQVVVLLLVFLTVLLGMSALVIDVGRAYYAQRALQSSVDSAALAGAVELPDSDAARAKALEYSGSAGAKNQRGNVEGVTTTVTTKCGPYGPCKPVNTLVVESKVKVKTMFAGILGHDFINITVRGAACNPCGSRPLDIMLVLDRTGSMCMDHHGRSDPFCTDLRNARDGMKTFLGYFDSETQWIGLGVFPPARSLGTRCSTPASSNYDERTADYVIVPLSNDYRTSSGGLNNSSNLVSTINCQKGGGQTAYANAIDEAQAELTRSGRSDVQDVIVLFSDGAANTGPDYYSTSSPYRRTPCNQGVTSAGAAKARGTLIYTIGYDLNALDGGANTCRAYSSSGPLESPAVTAYQAIQRMASSVDHFYNQPTPGELNTIFTAIAADIAGASLVPEDL